MFFFLLLLFFLLISPSYFSQQTPLGRTATANMLTMCKTSNGEIKTTFITQATAKCHILLQPDFIGELSDVVLVSRVSGKAVHLRRLLTPLVPVSNDPPIKAADGALF